MLQSWALQVPQASSAIENSPIAMSNLYRPKLTMGNSFLMTEVFCILVDWSILCIRKDGRDCAVSHRISLDIIDDKL